MVQFFEHLRTEALRLPVNERADLAFTLLQSLDSGSDADAEAAWDAELAKRMRQIERGEVAGEPAENVFARLREKYS